MRIKFIKILKTEEVLIKLFAKSFKRIILKSKLKHNFC